jgi:hypothetical protein
MKKNLSLVTSMFLAVALSLYSTENQACTTAIVSGRYTPDGRPLLLKHRDTNTLDNKLVILQGGKYRAIALTDTKDREATQAWIGFNEAGFAIMNAASYNLNSMDSAAISDQEGILMKKALLECRTVEDFEALLAGMTKPLGVEANFGVIDANGGAAYFETGNSRFTKIDVNDPRVAPHGFIVRTNYSFTGETGRGAGYIRFETAEDLFEKAAARNDLTVNFILKDISRCVHNSLTGEDLLDYRNLHQDESKFMYFQDCTVRPSTAASVVIQGIRPEESPGLTTMWTILGFPLASVAIPVWLTPENRLPSILTAAPGEKAMLCSMALGLKKKMVPVTRGNGKYYIQTTSVINTDGTGILQRILPLEEEIRKEAENHLGTWRKTGINPFEMNEFYRYVDTRIARFYPALLE